MEETRWESRTAEALLEEFFSRDNLRQLALSAGELLDCPLLVLDDTFHVAAHHLPLGFSDELFQNAVRRGEITYEAGVIISKNPMLSAGWADYVQLPDSPYRRRFAPLISSGVRLGCLICVDIDGHLKQIPPHTWELVERILAKQLFMEVSRQDKPFEMAGGHPHAPAGRRLFLRRSLPASGVRHLPCGFSPADLRPHRS